MGTHNKKILYGGLLILVAFLILGIIFVNSLRNKVPEVVYEFPAPETVVQQYFVAWNNKDYPNMYATLSDGFKKIDPNAKDLDNFREFAAAQGIEGVNILEIRALSNDGTTASVAYSIEFILSDGTKKPFGDKLHLNSEKEI